MRRRLLAVPGVSQVTPIGGDTKQYQVVLSARRLQAYDLTALAVLHALEQTNENVAGGILSSGTQEMIVEGIGRVVSEADIGDTVVTVRGLDLRFPLTLPNTLSKNSSPKARWFGVG